LNFYKYIVMCNCTIKKKKVNGLYFLLLRKKQKLGPWSVADTVTPSYYIRISRTWVSPPQRHRAVTPGQWSLEFSQARIYSLPICPPDNSTLCLIQELPSEENVSSWKSLGQSSAHNKCLLNKWMSPLFKEIILCLLNDPTLLV
jgi:hypothetical protein